MLFLLERPEVTVQKCPCPMSSFLIGRCGCHSFPCSAGVGAAEVAEGQRGVRGAERRAAETHRRHVQRQGAPGG